jgi:hypothetical protein
MKWRAPSKKREGGVGGGGKLNKPSRQTESRALTVFHALNENGLALPSFCREIDILFFASRDGRRGLRAHLPPMRKLETCHTNL